MRLRDVLAAPIPARLLTVSLASAGWLLGASHVAQAAWPTDTITNLAVCTESHDQALPRTAPDGLGGQFVVWRDQRTGTTPFAADVYAQHVLASGVVDPLWPATGLPVCTAANQQDEAYIVADGLGGAIIAWQDLRSGTYDIYAQRVLGIGTVDPAWPLNGRALCTAAEPQYLAAIVADGNGGAIVTWQDFRTYDATGIDIYAQRVRGTGTVDPAWPVNGVAMCAAAGDQTLPVIASDGTGGAVAAWIDARSMSGEVIAAAHVLSSGTTDPAWTANGVLLSDAVANFQYRPAITADGSGGAYVVWQDLVNGTQNNIVAQHILVGGLLNPAWTSSGLPLCSGAGNRLYPVIVSDGAGGAYAAWQETHDASGWNIRAGRLRPSGIDPLWPVNGLEVCALAEAQQRPSLVSDGAGGAFIAWEDDRAVSSTDVYAQRLTASGAVAASWPANGRAVCTAADDQGATSVTPDLWGGLLVTWADRRSGTNYDLYAQRLGADGLPGPVPASVAGEAPRAIALAKPYPNPARFDSRLGFTLTRPAAVRLEVYDEAGRLVRSLESRTFDAGQQSRVWDLRGNDGRAVSPGIYFARLRFDGVTSTQRIVVAR